MLRIALRVAVALLAFLSGASAAGVWNAVRTKGRAAEPAGVTAPRVREFTSAPVATDEKAEREIRDIIRRYDVAQTEHDASFFRSVEAESFTLTTEGWVVTREQDIADMLTWPLGTRYVSDDVRVQLYGHAAVVTGRMTAIPLAEGGRYGSSWRWVDLFVKRDGRWQVISTALVD
jgi:Domain of unknown function (DUF4440)